MKRILLSLSVALGLAASANAFEQKMIEAAQLCHNYVWDVREFEGLPNAAISVFPGIENDDQIVVFWNVYWDDPVMRVAGNCTVINGVLEGYENYLEQN